MNDALAQLPLRDYHLPAEVSWWPLAPGWWVILASILIISLTVVFLLQYRRAHAIKRRAMRDLGRIIQTYKEANNAVSYVKSVSLLLRQVSMTYFARKSVAGLTGKQWLLFLDRILENDKSSMSYRFDGPIGEVLIKAPYDSHRDMNHQIDVNELQNLVTAWIKALPNKKQKH